MKKCIGCGSSKVHQTVIKGVKEYNCESCGDTFNEEDINTYFGKKSKKRNKFTRVNEKDNYR